MCTNPGFEPVGTVGGTRHKACDKNERPHNLTLNTDQRVNPPNSHLLATLAAPARGLRTTGQEEPTHLHTGSYPITPVRGQVRRCDSGLDLSGFSFQTIDF